MTETMPARWDRATATTLTRLRETTGRPVSFLVTQAVLHATNDRADLTDYFATPARTASSVSLFTPRRPAARRNFSIPSSPGRCGAAASRSRA